MRVRTEVSAQAGPGERRNAARNAQWPEGNDLKPSLSRSRLVDVQTDTFDSPGMTSCVPGAGSQPGEVLIAK